MENENAVEQMPTTNLSFGQALTYLKQGKFVARSGWNGKGMFLYLVEGTTVEFEKLRGNAKEAAMMSNKIEGNIDNTPSSRVVGSHIDMKDAWGHLVIGWLASQTDMLAEDWCVVA